MAERVTIIRPTDGLGLHANTVVKIDLGVGFQGPQGAPGAAGYNHTQGSASVTWTIAHNLGMHPIVQARTVGGVLMLGEVVHLSNNVAQISFTSAVAGTARCV